MSDKLKALRKELKNQNLDGFLVPHADEYMSEYTAAYAERLAWISGFDGSAGEAVILHDAAYVASDGRYTLQLEAQVDKTLFDLGNTQTQNTASWISEHAARGAKIGYDPFLHTAAQIDALKRRLSQKDIELCAVEKNLIDSIWTDQPSKPLAQVMLYPEKYAGKSSQDKAQDLADKLKDTGLDAAIISAPDSVAWLLNIRGGDVANTPVALSYAVLHKDGHVDWVIESSKVSNVVREALGNMVSLVAPENLKAHLEELGANSKRIGIDKKRSPVWFYDMLDATDAKIEDIKDPVIDPRAAKNETEINAMRESHKRDGKVLTEFFDWLKKEAEKGKLTELDIVKALRQKREETGVLLDDSFDTICGWNENGAVIHYRVTPDTNLAVIPNGILLIDSGAQYIDGTTDVTRTISIGKPTDEQRINFTRVLKGHISLARAVFPEGTTGAQLDTLARKPLWDAGLDYAHGTGHGVGLYLSVHEEAAGISPRSHQPLKAGMVLSNEPGYYKNGAYGIRIENLVAVRDTGRKDDLGRSLLEFETLTLVPLDHDLIDMALLSHDEKQWLLDYHERCAKNMA